MAGKWAGKTFGGKRLHKWLIALLRIGGTRPPYLMAALFIVPFCWIFNRSRRTSYAFYRERLGFGRFKSVGCSMANHYAFAKVIIDRFAMYAGRIFEVEIEGTDYYQALSSREEGFIQLSSHIGNYEIAGYSLKAAKPINAIVFAEETSSVMENRNTMFEKTNNRMIVPEADMSHLFEIDRAICRGEVVSFPADRSLPNGKSLSASFFGAEASFPQGPFSTATMRGLDVLAVNVMKESRTGYKIIITPLEYDKTAPRKEQLRGLLHSYTAELERVIRLYPTQWFNFFDFWTDEN